LFSDKIQFIASEAADRIEIKRAITICDSIEAIVLALINPIIGAETSDWLHLAYGSGMVQFRFPP